MPDPDPVVLDYNEETTSWRYRCPNGHAQAEPTNEHWWCRTCAQLAEQGAPIEPEFEALEDTKTGRQLQRDQVEIRGGRRATS